MPRLMPLRIPPTWCVVVNKFVELPPPAETTQDDRDAYLSEDIISMVSASFSGDDWRTDDDSLVLDLGWYRRDGIGHYRLCLLRESWDNVLISIEDTDQYRIRDHIDTILERLASGEKAEQVAASYLTD